jgi:hypothetical protein
VVNWGVLGLYKNVLVRAELHLPLMLTRPLLVLPGNEGTTITATCAPFVKLSTRMPGRHNCCLPCLVMKKHIAITTVVVCCALCTFCRHTNQTGVPLMRPLWFEFPEQAALYGVEQEFLLGPAILVKPVVEVSASSVCCMPLLMCV